MVLILLLHKNEQIQEYGTGQEARFFVLLALFTDNRL